MKNFLAVYLGTPVAMAGWNTLPEAERQKRQAEGLRAWHTWVEMNKGSIVDVGAPLGKTKRASATGLSDIRNNLTGYTVVRAESHEAAAKLFDKHPHFTIFPGESVEIMECLPVPGA